MPNEPLRHPKPDGPGPRPAASDEGPSRLERVSSQFRRALDQVAGAKPFAKSLYHGQVLDLTIRLLKLPEGPAELYKFAPEFDAAGVFFGGDWAFPESLQPSFVRNTLRGPAINVALESLSQLRMLALAQGRATHPNVTAGQARVFLEEVLALNMDLLFPEASEASRAESVPLTGGVQKLLEFVFHTLGPEGVLSAILQEAHRVLLQRPILVGRVKRMLASAERTLDACADSNVRAGLLELVHALRGPTPLSRRAASPAEFEEALGALDEAALRDEASAFANAMRASGLVCPLHAVLLRHLNANHPELLADALGLDTLGRESLLAYRALLTRVIETAIHPPTAQSILGLACLLERGVLFFGPVAPSLWRLIDLPVRPEVAAALRRNETADLPADAILLSGMLSILGQPLGVGQGNNPTCQSARAISLWAQSDIGSLLDMTICAARDGEIDMHFEGRHLLSSVLDPGLAPALEADLDPVSTVLVPHLDRVYAEMWRLASGRGEDPHKWINPEFHGWWVHRGFASTFNMITGAVQHFGHFIRLFYATYHPYYNGNLLLAFPEPAGVIATSRDGTFLGYHAVTIQRVMLDEYGTVRVYFYNPNNDGGQDWGQGIVTSTHGCGETPGESSLPIEQFAARLYVFHYNPREAGPIEAVPEAEVASITALAQGSWGARFAWT